MPTSTFRVLLWILLPVVPGVCQVSQAADPLDWGPYRVGVRTEVFVDETRNCAITDAPRTLVTEIWYPTTNAAEEYPVNRFADFWGRPAGVAVGHLAMAGFGGSFQKINENFRNVAHRAAPLHDGRFPLLIFSHGNGGLRHQNTFQAEYLASHGYIVAAPDHTGNAAVTVLPDRIVPYNKDTRKAEEQADDRPHDISFLISHLTKLAASTDHWLANRLTPKEIGVFGHSFGGYTSCRAIELDDRIKAIIPMTLAFTVFPDDKEEEANEDGVAGEKENGNEDNKDDGAQENFDVGEICTIPLMVILGDVDRTVDERGNKRSTQYFEQATGARYLLNFKDAGHFTFTEMPQLNPDWGDGVGVERDKEGNVTFTFSDAAEDQRITNVYSIAFFDAFLKHDQNAQAFLNKDHFPEELVYRRN